MASNVAVDDFSEEISNSESNGDEIEENYFSDDRTNNAAPKKLIFEEVGPYLYEPVASNSDESGEKPENRTCRLVVERLNVDKIAMERAPPPPYSEAIHYQQSYVPSVTSATADNEPGDQTRESEASDNAVSNALPPSYSESNIQYGVDSASPEDPLIPQANNNRNTAEVNSSARDQEEPPPSYQAPHAQVIVGYSSQSSSGVTYTFTPAQPQYATGHYYAHTPKTLVGGQTPYSLAPYPSSFYPSQDVNVYNGSYQGYPPQVNPACNFNPQTPATNVQGYSTTPLAYGHQVSSDRDKNSQAKLFCLCACIGIVAIMIIMPYYMGLYQNT